MAQTIYARLYLRKRIWFNQHLHLSSYKNENISDTHLNDALQELLKNEMIITDQSIFQDIQKHIYIQDSEIKIGGNVLENFYQFLDGFSVKKLSSILKIFNTKIKNVILDNFVDV